MATERSEPDDAMETDVDDAMDIDAEAAQTYDVIERDMVPASAPRADDSLQQRIAELVKWLQPTDFLSPGNEFMKHMHSYVPGTGGWVHESGSPFRVWAGLDDYTDTDSAPGTAPGDSFASHRQYDCLHVRGVAGSGKSVLAANAVRQLQESGRIVLFFFFRQIVDKNHTARYLVRDFAAQLLPHCPALVAALTTLSQEHAVRGNELGLVWPALVKVLKDDEAVKARVFCVVDGLDEMDDGDFEGMAARLVALATTEPAKVKIMMTSRPLPHIERALSHPGVMRLRLDPALLSPDVARYIDARMATLDPPLSDEKHALVGRTICECANGLFLQARLMADNLAEGLRDGWITQETLPDSLDRLPRTLRAVYEDMLREHARRSGVTAEQQAKILMCVTHASRPLRLIELGSLLSRMLQVDLRRGKDLVRAGCGRLLELLEDETVSVIHHSFTEFLHDTTRKDDGDGFPVLDNETSHAMLAVLLLEYLDGCPHLDATIDDRREAEYEETKFNSQESTRRDVIRTDIKVSQPLASYAVENLFFHINKVPPGESGNQVLAALDRCLVPGKPAFETWMLMNWSGPLSASVSVCHIFTTAPTGALTPIYVLEHLVAREPALLDSRDLDGRTPLANAADNGYSELAEVLLARGADPTSGGNDGLTPLHLAAAAGSATVVRLLLNAGVDPLIKTWPVLRVWNYYDDFWEEYDEEHAEARRETALAHAIRSNNNDVVKAFIPFIPPDEINKNFHRLHTPENVKAILETGKVDVDCFRSGATKLYLAARAWEPDLIKLLLDYGADPNKRCDTDKLRRSYLDDESAMEILQSADCERGPAPLHALAGLRLGYDYHSNTLHSGDKERVAECLRLLLEAGADVNATMDDDKGGQDMTPLHCATQKRNESGDSLFGSWGALDQTEGILTELLLQAGANPNAKTKNGNTPLHLANPEKLRLFEMLVEGGADINAVNAWGRPPLLEMISRHRLEYSQYQSPSNRGDRPNVKIFERLLELGADVLVADHQGDTVFHHILHNIRSFTNADFIPFVEKLLCAGGADLLNKRNKKGQPPLWKYMCCSGSSGYNDDDEGLLRSLVDAGMDLNARDEEGRTILWVLCTRYGTDVRTIEKLVRLGADPGALTHDGRTLLHAAPQRPEWLRYLISAGARPEALDKDGNTIIHAMLSGTDAISYAPEVLRVLVEAGAQPLAKNAKGQSALHVVGALGNLDIVLSNPAFRGLDVNEPDVDGFTPLHHAVRLGEKAVWKLVRAGADPTALAAGGTSPLHIAARSREPGVVGLLLAQYRKLNALEAHVNLLDGDGRTPLHYACRSGSLEAVWTLLRNRADARITDEKGLTPLHALAEFEPPEKPLATDPLPRADDIVGMLLLAGADLNAEAVVQTQDETAPRTLTPLGLAVEKGFWELVRGLVAHGAEPSDDHRLSPDFVLATDKDKAADAARKAQASVPPRGQGSSNSRRGRGRPWRGRWAACPGARMPLEEGTRFVSCGQDILDAKVQVQDGSGENNGDKSEVKDKVYGVDILYGVLRDGDYDTIKEYALLGGDMFELDQWHDNTFLHHLVKEGHAEILEYFGSYVTELESQEWVQKDEQSCGTLLGTACERILPSLYMVQTLVDKLGVDVNAVYNRLGACYKLRGATALHILASGSSFWQVEALEYLISKGADIEARNSDGMTPLLAAIDKQYPDGFWPEETVRVLLEHGADVNATVKATGTVSRGLSALETSSSPVITKLLLSYGASVENCPGMLTRAVREWMEPGIVELLLDAGLDPNELSSLQEQQHDNTSDEMDESVEDDGDGEVEDGHTDKTNIGPRYPLHEAARPTSHWNPPVDFELRQQAVIDLLLSRGADAYAPYPDGSFVLQAIVEDRGQVRSFLHGLSRTNCNVRGHHGRTLLASACIPVIPVGPEIFGNDTPNPQTVMVDVVHALLNCGADALALDDDGRTPLHWLCTFPGQFDEAHRNAFVALARHGPAAVKIPDKQGRKPLHLALATYATRSQHSPFATRSQHSPFAIQHLLSVGADPADPDPVTGNSALHFVAPRLVGECTAAAAATALFRELATAPRGVDINFRNGQGETPVFAFAAAGWEATRDPAGKVGNPTYALAHDTTHAKALDVFVDLGADLAAVDARRRTLLHVTAWRGSRPNGGSDYVEWEDVVGAFKRLMELGVDPRAEDDELRTAIDVAVARNWTGIVLLFSEEGKRMEEEKRARREKEAEGGSGSDTDTDSEG